MTLNRFAARTDKNEREIIKALEKVGAHVYRIKKPLDLLVCYRGRLMLMEVKTKNGKFTKAQKDFMAAWPGFWSVVYTPWQALEAIGIDYI